MVLSGGDSGTAVLERILEPFSPILETAINPEVIGYTPKSPSGCYLTLVESSSARGFSGILMSLSKTDVNDVQIFYHNYLIRAIGDSMPVSILEFYLARSYQQSEDPRLYILNIDADTIETNADGNWPVASEVPLIPCGIKAIEYGEFKANIEGKKLDGVVKDMLTLIEWENPEFKLVNGMLVPPPNYANKLI